MTKHAMNLKEKENEEKKKKNRTTQIESDIDFFSRLRRSNDKRGSNF